MDLHTPMKLYRGLELIGLVTGYSYDQPWATGTVEDVDRSRAERSERAALYRRWLNENEDELPEDNATYSELCEREMTRRNVAQADVDWCEHGTWMITTQDGVHHHPHSLEFIGDHLIQWRW